MLNFVASFLLNGATCSQVYGGIGTATGNSSSGLLEGISQVNAASPLPGSDTFICVPGSVVSVSVPTTYYGKVAASYSAGTPQFKGRLTATRIA
jgi:hypothetical protein